MVGNDVCLLRGEFSYFANIICFSYFCYFGVQREITFGSENKKPGRYENPKSDAEG